MFVASRKRFSATRSRAMCWVGLGVLGAQSHDWREPEGPAWGCDFFFFCGGTREPRVEHGLRVHRGRHGWRIVNVCPWLVLYFDNFFVFVCFVCREMRISIGVWFGESGKRGRRSPVFTLRAQRCHGVVVAAVRRRSSVALVFFF